jgi:hypothetical protein
MKFNPLILGLLLVLIAGGLYLTQNPAAAGCSFARPWFGSYNCQKVDNPTTETVLMGTIKSMFTGTTQHSDYIDAKYTGMSNPQFPVPSCNLGGISELKLESKYPQDTQWQGEPDYWCWKNGVPMLISSCQSIFSQQMLLDPQKEYRVEATCTFITIGGLDTQPAINKFDYSWKLQYNQEQYYRYVDSSGGVPIDNTEGCKFNDLVESYYGPNTADQPASSTWSKIMAASPILQKIFGGFSPAATQTAIPLDSYAGQAYLFVYDWVVRPDLTVGTYQGQNVYCYSDGTTNTLYKVESVNTQSGACYSIPTSSVATVGCCDDTICLLKQGVNYGCDNQGAAATYTCKLQMQTGCTSDFDCGSGQTTCIKDTDNKFYSVASSKCVSGQCQTPAKTAVKCCQGMCAGGEWCDQTVGCKNTKTPCPTGQWCVENNECPYFSQGCPNGLEACAGDTCSGLCAQKCENPQNKTCLQSCNNLDFGCYAGCIAEGTQATVIEWLGNVFTFVAAIVSATVVGLLVDNSLAKTMKKAKDQPKRVGMVLLTWLIVFVIVNMVI